MFEVSVSSLTPKSYPTCREASFGSPLSVISSSGYEYYVLWAEGTTWTNYSGVSKFYYSSTITANTTYAIVVSFYTQNSS